MESLDKSVEVSKLLREVFMLTKNIKVKSFENTGMTATQGMVVGMLNHFGKMKISELSCKLGLSDSTVSGIVDRMEKQDVVERTRSEKDRRVVYVGLSPRFDKMHTDCHVKFDGFFSNIINEFKDDDMNKIIEGLRILKKLLQEHEKIL